MQPQALTPDSGTTRPEPSRGVRKSQSDTTSVSRNSPVTVPERHRREPQAFVCQPEIRDFCWRRRN